MKRCQFLTKSDGSVSIGRVKSNGLDFTASSGCIAATMVTRA